MPPRISFKEHLHEVAGIYIVDIGDYVRFSFAASRLIPAIKNPIPASYGVSVQTDGKLESLTKNGILEVSDFVPVYQDYLDKAYDYAKHAYGASSFGKRIINCINAGSECTKDPKKIAQLDVDMNGTIAPIDALGVANFMSCIDKLRDGNSFTASIKLTPETLIRSCGF
jgi:hypothetical protein